MTDIMKLSRRIRGGEDNRKYGKRKNVGGLNIYESFEKTK